MNKNAYKTIKLSRGEMNVYDFGGIRLHAYKTNDPLSDEVCVIEKDGRGIVIESPCFYDNIAELTEYLSDIAVEGVLVSYHGAGGSFLPDAPKLATKNAEEYSAKGGGKALIDKFAAAFGESFDRSVHRITEFIGEGRITLAGIELIIKKTDEAFDIEIPGIKTVYTHMLGHDCHSIVAGASHADAIIAQLEGYISSGYELILTSHYTPEDLKDAQVKIDYIRSLKRIAESCSDADGFRAEVKRLYPEYSGENYLEMTSGFFFA